MPQRDYLMKQIDQLGQVLATMMAKLLGFKDDGLINDGIEWTNEMFRIEFDFDIEALTEIPTDELVEVLQENHKFKNTNLEQLANIMLLIADELYVKEADNAKSINLYAKCLNIYNYLNKTESVYSFDRHMKIDWIKKIL